MAVKSAAAALLEKRLAALELFGHEEEDHDDAAEAAGGGKKKKGSKKKKKPPAKAEEDEILDSFGSILTTIDLSAATPEEQLGDAGAARLREALTGKVETLKRLNLRRSGLGIEGYQEVGLLVRYNCPALEELVLSGNNAGPAALKGEPAEAINRAKNLRVLELQGCGLTDVGLEPLCEVMERFDEALYPVVGIKKLVLGTNRITAAGATRLGKMLSTNKKLEDLDLQDNELGQDGGHELAKGLIANKGRLARLNVSQNTLRVSGARPLFDVFLSKDAKFTIRINRKQGTKHGFVLDSQLVVTGLEFQGWIEKHNMEHQIDAVFIGDRIIDVNGKTEPADMMNELTVTEILDITLTRDGVCMEYLDISFNNLSTTGAEELRSLVGMELQGSLLGSQLRFDGGTRIVVLNAG